MHKLETKDLLAQSVKTQAPTSNQSLNVQVQVLVKAVASAVLFDRNTVIL